MSLRVYNSLTQKKETFAPLKKGKVSMYVCGITAYDSCHLGHARAAVAFDVVYRYLKFLGNEVTYVRNFTDIDDKIINRSKEKNIPWKELTERYIQEYRDDMSALQILTPTQEPRATEFIPQMIGAIQTLIEKKKAYEKNGNVYYAVREFKKYGALSQKNIEDLESGARIEIDETKKDPLDFALWKAAKPGEPTWPSPWGEKGGRPGWHIECSVMSTKLLGQPFDIHGGGRDLIFPHHENEIAQAEGMSQKNFCNYFLHNGFVNIDAEKMSKSKGNFTTIRQVIKQHDAEVVRYFLMSAHYSSPIDYTEKNMLEAKLALDRYYLLLGRLNLLLADQKIKKMPKPSNDLEKELAKSLEEFPSKFKESMDDDFNVPKSLGYVFEIVRIFNKYLDQTGTTPAPFLFWARDEWMKMQKEIFEPALGIFISEPQKYFERFKKNKSEAQSVSVELVESKIAERRQARSNKDFKKSDTIRDELMKLGVELKDRPDGTTEWHFK
ncbi:MAG: cysteine--tRNA ligase [Deltaproteobacteria bacterium RIFCSPLOWO2_02_FULL_46_8]|nr:MAG: cysteine--tRNA ligase [Deltaproteobacteria bacterium RIFCSPLOWO2_02_FULL_46_8]